MESVIPADKGQALSHLSARHRPSFFKRSFFLPSYKKNLESASRCLDVIENGIPQITSLETTMCAEIVHVEQMVEERRVRNRSSRWRGYLWRVQQAIGRWRSERRRGRDIIRTDSFLERFATTPMTEVVDIHEEVHWWNRFSSPFIVDPSESFHYQWLSIISVAVLYNVIMIIGRSVFWELQNISPVTWYCLDYLCDSIYIFDMGLHARTGYLEHGLLVKDTRKLSAKYFKSYQFKLDLLSLAPTDLLYLILGTSCTKTVPCTVIVRLNRLLRFYRMLEFFDRTETRTNHPYALRIAKLIFYILVIIHWDACLYFAVSYAIGFGSDGWVYKNISEPKFASFTHQYIYCFYWSTLTLTTIGEVPIPEKDVEYVFVVIDFLIGVLIFATIVGNVGSMITNMNAVRSDFQRRMDNVKQYMEFRKVGKELENRVIKWFDYLWINRQSLDEDSVTSVLPDKLKAEIAIHVHLDTLKRVHLFHDCEPGLLVQLVLKLKLQVFSPGDYICRKGDVGKEMYIVKRGRLNVVGDDGKSIYATLCEGSVFGELSILNISGVKTGNRRTANVRSVGFSDLFCLSKEDLWNVLAEYPEAQKMLIERGREILIKDGLLDENVVKKEEEERNQLHIRCDRIQDALETLQGRFAHLLAEYTASQKKLKRRITRLENAIGADAIGDYQISDDDDDQIDQLTE
ncbi:cyclic nucleotide-gated channel alpha-3-like [Centruroides vittatus]|uniref:cyclic nucleotide-gated channel alpha-3-like n=1 Tax=Centruroides vittatus TaxID=120091 RepID=UPI00350F7C7D